MKRIVTGILCSGLLLGLGIQTLKADDKADSERLKEPVQRVNDDAKRGNVDQVLRGISVETGVPRDAVESMHKRYSEEKVANIMIACVIADQTKAPPEDLLKRHHDGKSWPEVARENRVPVGLIAERLDRLDRQITRPVSERDVKRR